MARDDVLVRALPLGGQWENYGVDAMRGITVEGLKLGADDWGPHDLACSLQRDPNVAFADLQAATPLEVEVGGSLLWTGRVAETPTSEVNRSISVQGEGIQFSLDDDVYQRVYLHTSLKDWTDTRQAPNTTLAVPGYGAQGQVSTDGNGQIYLGNQINVPLAAGTRNGVMIDLGPNKLASGVYILITSSNNTGNEYLYVRGMNTPQFGINESTYGYYDLGVGAVNVGNPVAQNNGFLGGPGAAYGGFFVPVRYICIFNYVLTGYTPGADTWFKVNACAVSGASIPPGGLNITSGGVSVLFASDVIKDALTRAPLVSTDRSLIASTSFGIPDLDMTSYQTPRQVATAVNAYHAFQMRIRADYRPEFRARPSSPLLTLVSGTFDDASAGSLDQVYNRCAGIANGPDGFPIVSNQVPSPDTTIPGRRGYTKTNVLDTNMSLTQAALDQLSSVFVQSHLRTPFKGTLTVSGWEAIAMTVGGAFVPVWELLQYVGELIHFPSMTDPDTGAKGRDGRISAVSYDHDTRTASVSIDSQRTNFEALLARLQIVAGQVG